jgi:hypothetical protein
MKKNFPEKLTISQLVKEFSFHENSRVYKRIYRDVVKKMAKVKAIPVTGNEGP